MNIFSNIGITELILILLLALLVVGPERLPELARQLGKTLRDLRKAYDNLTSDLGPELLSIQKTTNELRESVESIRSIPNDMLQQVVKAADLDDTIEELKGVSDSVGQIGQTLSDAGKVIKSPVGAAASAARSTLLPDKAAGQEKAKQVSERAQPAPELGEAIEEPEEAGNGASEVAVAVHSEDDTSPLGEPVEEENTDPGVGTEEQQADGSASAEQKHE